MQCEKQCMSNVKLNLLGTAMTKNFLVIPVLRSPKNAQREENGILFFFFKEYMKDIFRFLEYFWSSPGTLNTASRSAPYR